MERKRKKERKKEKKREKERERERGLDELESVEENGKFDV